MVEYIQVPHSVVLKFQSLQVISSLFTFIVLVVNVPWMVSHLLRLIHSPNRSWDRNFESAMRSSHNMLVITSNFNKNRMFYT